jgi:glutaredoxin
MTTLLARLFGSPRRTRDLTFTVYTRAACCCCHKALDLLRDRQRRWGFRIEEVDIDADPGLVAMYDTEVPVVALDGKVRFRGVVNPVLLDRLLRGS